jgi:hypothetical protein
MKTEILNKLTPEARERIIRIEARIKELNEEKILIDNRLASLEN